MMRLSAFVPMLCLLVLSGVVACNGDSDDDGGDNDAARLTADEYNRRFDIVQEEQDEMARRRLAALPPAEIRSSDGLDDAERAYLRQFAQVRETNAIEMGRALQALSPPEELQPAHEAFLRALADRVRFLREAMGRIDTATMAAEIFEGQQQVNSAVYEACAALNEDIVAAGVRPPLANCSLEETPARQ